MGFNSGLKGLMEKGKSFVKTGGGGSGKLSWCLDSVS
jgi:hypothetical protein